MKIDIQLSDREFERLKEKIMESGMCGVSEYANEVIRKALFSS